MHKKVLAHFKKSDKKLYSLCVALNVKYSIKPVPQDSYFERLCESIVSQQLSVKVSDAIYARFKNLFAKGMVTPEALIKLKDEQIRKAGISNSKVSYLKGLARHFVQKSVSYHKFEKMTDLEIIEELTKIKGVGVWTAEMFLMFSLGREDIFSFGDLGLKNAIKRIYNKESKEEIEKITIKWSPYRTFACRVLWESLDNQ
jgi:DNA-3-methyladenine glycosylase II